MSAQYLVQNTNTNLSGSKFPSNHLKLERSPGVMIFTHACGTAIQQKMPVWPHFRSMYMFIMRFLFSCCGKFRLNMGADVSAITKIPATNTYIKAFRALMHLLFLYIKMTSLYWNSTLSMMRTSGANITHSEFPYFLKRNQRYCTVKMQFVINREHKSVNHYWDEELTQFRQTITVFVRIR